MQQLKICAVTLLFTFYFSFSQVNISNQLFVGDKCPDFYFSGVVNSENSTMHLSDLSGKLVILDLGASWCGPCVSALPKLDSLQKSFYGKIEIIPDTYEKAEKIINMLEKNKSLKAIKLKFITGDTLLRTKYFLTRIIPQEVWIDGKGIVRSITNIEQINAKNIQAFLDGLNPQLPQKKDIVDFDLKKPLILDALPGYRIERKNLFYNSTLTGELPGLPSTGSPAQIIDSSVKIYGVNMYITQLYQIAYIAKMHRLLNVENPDYGLQMSGRVILEVKDSSIFYWPGKKPFSDDYYAPSFCYDLLLPERDSLKIFSYMREDLNRIFGALYGIEGKLEKRKVKCWSLIKFSADDKIHSKGGKSEFNRDIHSGTYHLKNKSIADLMFNLCMYEFMDYPIPIIEQTNYSGNIDLDFTADLSDLQSVSQALEKFGLKFILTEKEMDMIVVKDRNKY